jgi:hypothetical protein
MFGAGARCRLKLMASRAHKSGPVVRVRTDRLGGWEVSVPGRRGLLRCENLNEAKRVAHQCAAQGNARELIVYDAYHRVLERERIEHQAKSRAA